MRTRLGLVGGFLLTVVAGAAFIAVLSWRLAGIPPLGTLLDPVDGLYRNARRADRHASFTLDVDGLSGPVTVVRDERGVPHIFAQHDLDAVTAMGYVVAQDRLFQMDFIPRVASGRLASALGPAAVQFDRALRRTGMVMGARRNLARIEAEHGIEWELITHFAAGVNAYLDGLGPHDLPVEFRLLGYRPDPYTPMQTMLVLQYMAYDLTYNTDDADYGLLKQRLSAEDYARLYPRYATLFAPIVPEKGGLPRTDAPVYGRIATAGGAGGMGERWHVDALAALRKEDGLLRRLRGTMAEAFIEGKGSNNWGVASSRSTTGAPILAGDMHLSLTLPAIWYEVHLVTPSMNTYGVTIPGAPLPVEAFNDRVAWAFTNTGSDQIDHLALRLDSTGQRYRYEGDWRELRTVPDTIRVNGGAAVIDTLTYAHWGPVLRGQEGAVAIRWVAHDTSRTLAALWGMNHADGYDTFEQALRSWDTPMQNILYADADGNLAIRSTGYLPLRRAGQGAGLLDGSTDDYEWTGRVPFEALPHSLNPRRGFLFSNNQQPADSTYACYLGHDWRTAYRSLRIDTLLSRKPRHSVDDLKAYQADVHAVQRDLFVPLLAALNGLSDRADTLRTMLAAWDGRTGVDRPEPLVLDEFLRNLRGAAWDEPAFDGVRKPTEAVLYTLLRDDPGSKWFDVVGTDLVEDGPALLRHALEATADTLTDRYGWNVAAWRWGDHHKVVFRHLIPGGALAAFGRGPDEYPGFSATLSPAGSRMTTHSASWRVVVDLSRVPVAGYGVYPGGQRGSPFARLYDDQLPTYTSFAYYPLLKPPAPGDIPADSVLSTITLRPTR